MTNTPTNDKHPTVILQQFPTLTYAILRDYIDRAYAVIRESDSADEHADLTDELDNAVRQLDTLRGPGYTGNFQPEDVAHAAFVREIRDILIDRRECWRIELSGADVIEQLTAALDAFDLGATMTACERPDCEQVVARIGGRSVCDQCLEEDQTEPRVIYADGGRSHAAHCPCWDCHPEDDPDRPPDGWTLYHTGGGCHCWQKEFPSGVHCWLTDEDAQPPQDRSKPCALGFYNKAGECVAMLQARDVAHALDMVACLVMIEDESTGQSDATPHDDGSLHSDPHCTCNTCMAAHAKAQDKPDDGKATMNAVIASAIRENVIENVIEALARFNVTATHEYPGYLAVQFNGGVYDFGTADGERWGGNTHDGREALPMPAIPADCDDAAVIAQGILVALLQPVQR